MRQLDRRMLLCVALIASYIQDATQLIIKELRVPPLIMDGTTEEVILDCDYDLEGTPPAGLVVKWFHNEHDLVYQWIMEGFPQATSVVEKYIDLTYKASDSNTTWYRAMRLKKPGFELTGDYTCTVSTMADEDTDTKRMVVYNTGKDFHLKSHKKTENGEDGVELTCAAEGLYPRPTLDVSVKNSPVLVKPQVSQNVDGLYSIKTIAFLKDADLSDPSDVKCVLGIPEAKFTDIPQELVYYPGPSTTTTSTSTTLQRKMDIQALDNSQQDTQNGGGSTASSVANGLVLLLTSVTAVTVSFFWSVV